MSHESHFSHGSNPFFLHPFLLNQDNDKHSTLSSHPYLMHSKMAWNRERLIAEWKGGWFCCDVDHGMDWRAALKYWCVCDVGLLRKDLDSLLLNWFWCESFERLRLKNHNDITKKRGESSSNNTTTYSPFSYSLLQPLREHAGRLIWDNPDFLYAFDTLNKTSWFSSKPKDEQLKLKAVQSL